MRINTMQCCGVREISGLSGCHGDAGFKAGVITFLTASGGVPATGALIFTQAGKKETVKYGDQFAEWIIKNKLGTVNESGGGYINPNSQNPIYIYTWVMDRAAMQEFYNVEVLAPLKVRQAEQKRLEAERQKEYAERVRREDEAYRARVAEDRARRERILAEQTAAIEAARVEQADTLRRAALAATPGFPATPVKKKRVVRKREVDYFDYGF